MALEEVNIHVKDFKLTHIILSKRHPIKSLKGMGKETAIFLQIMNYSKIYFVTIGETALTLFS